MAKSNLENIVPALDLCKRIPAGEFADSALVWTLPWGGNEAIVETREAADEFAWRTVAPAPTLEEVLKELSGSIGRNALATCSKIDDELRFCVNYLDYEEFSANGADAALKVWLAVKEGN